MKKLIVLIILTISFSGYSQNDFTLDLNAVKTELKQNAVGFIVNYLRSYSGIERQVNSDKGFFTVTPEVSMQAGTADAFSQIILKLSGFFLHAYDTTVAGLVTLNSRRTMHLFPVSFGAETNTEFTFVNTLLEAGYIPYYQAPGNNTFNDFFKHTQFGIFLQAGFKSRIDSSRSSSITGGKIDESKEKFNRGILRSRIDFTIDTKNFMNNRSTGFGLIGKANYWFDFVNGRSYYKVDGRFRVYLTPNKFFDITYQKGSGAPNFNKGEQFGAGLSVVF